MKRLFISLFAAAAICTAAHATELNIIPLPAEVTTTEGKGSRIDDKTTWRITGADDATARKLRASMSSLLGADNENRKKTKNCIDLRMVSDDMQPEAYRLKVDKHGVTIEAADGAGLFYGLQTLRQLIENSGDNMLSPMEITDSPRFGYRGVMIDVSRNFRDKNFIKKQIDALSRMKINRLHLHLTDGAGWRMEIERYPRLTEYVAWRKGETWKQWDGRYCESTDPDAHGGYYTKDDLREIIDYASDRFITVIPEIEMPAHSEEVLAAYPELSCTGEPFKHSDFCIGNDQTFEFLQNVLDEVIEVFPSEYIHIGGDEASKQSWRTCEKCLKRMADEGLNNVDQLQSYFIKRIENYLNSKGRALIGWDEIMEGGLAPNATVLSWRGPQNGFKAAENGHDAVMAPGKYCYLDGYQDAPHTQPEAIGGYLPISLMYSFNPAPDSLAASTRAHIKGIEATLFTEYVATDDHAEYMLYPRVMATAEIGWTPQDRRHYDDFRKRALAFNGRLRDEGYNAFDLSNEIGNRKESTEPVDHLARGKRVIYNQPQWPEKYAAGGDTALTDGQRGGWIYTDGRWQGFYNGDTDRDMDVTIDLEKPTDITYIGAEFIQLCPPNVWFPEKVIISCSDDGENFTTLTTITTNLMKDNKVAFRTFSWAGNVRTRYVRYQAFNRWRFVFTDEIIIR